MSMSTGMLPSIRLLHAVTRSTPRVSTTLTNNAAACRDIVPLGQNKSNFNYNLDEKRVLNFENVVDDSDNVKQDMSIDVYGRQKDDGEADKASDKKVSITCSHTPCRPWQVILN